MRRVSVCILLFLFTQVSTYCQPPDVPFGGSYSPVLQKYLIGDRITYTCNGRFIRIGKEHRSCQATGKWSGSTPFCDSPAKVKNPRATSDPQNEVSNVIDDDPNTCFQSHNGTGQSLKVFLEDGRCVNVVRLFLPKGRAKFEVYAISNGVSKICDSFERDIEEAQWIKLHCKDNRNIAESLRISDISPRANILSICEIELYTKDDIWCETAPAIFVPNGYLEVNRDKATLRCNKGFREGEETRLVCEKNNTWAGPNLQCHEVLCDTVGNFSSADWRLEDIRAVIGSRKTIHCIQPDSVVVGHPPTVVCLEDGTWTSSTAVCTRKEDEESSLRIIGLSVGAAVVFVILLCLGLTLFCIYKQKKQVVVVYATTDPRLEHTETEGEYSTIYYETPYVTPQKPKLPTPNRLPADIAFGTLKNSTLYGT